MLSDEILKLFESANIDPKNFDHFDYAQAFEKLKEDYNSTVQRNPTKKKIIEQFIQKAYEQVSKKNPQQRKQKIANFIQRMEMNKRIKDEKLEAMRFISENYDQKANQLLFYPNFKNTRGKKSVLKEKNFFDVPLSASRNYWDEEQVIDMEEREEISEQKPIMEPNLTDQFSEDKCLK